MKRCHLLLAFSAVACLISACANQTYLPQPIEADKTAAHFDERNLSSLELQRYMQAQGYPSDAFPVRRWGLRELTLAAFFYHPQLAVARAQWQAARAEEITAGQKPNPSVSGNAEHHSRTDGGISPWTFGISFDIPIETGSKRQARIDRAISLSQAARIEIGTQAWQVRSRLQATLIEYQSARLQTELLQHELGLQSDIVQMLQKRLEAGMISDIDLGNARLQRQKTQQALAKESSHIEELQANLAGDIGIPAHALASIQLDAKLPEDFSTTALPSANLQRAALLNRLDIRSALARYEAAESKLRLEIAKQRPDIVLTPGYSFDQGDNRWSLGLSLLLALLNKNEGPIAEANAQRELEARQFEALQIRVISEQEQALTQYQARLAELDKAEQAVTSQQQRVAKTKHQFEAGLIDRLEWTMARMEGLAADQGRLAAAIRAHQARAALEDALQRPLDGTAPLALPEQNDEEPHS